MRWRKPTFRLTEMDQREIIRASLREAWKKVPEWINGASVQEVRSYKKTHAAMHKLLDKSGTSLSELTGALNQTRTIYK
jgi:hypothetical protein